MQRRSWAIICLKCVHIYDKSKKNLLVHSDLCTRHITWKVGFYQNEKSDMLPYVTYYATRTDNNVCFSSVMLVLC